MALNTITPSNREEEYLSAIAGDEGATAPVPSNRREEWLRRIAEGQGDQTDRLDHIEDQIPVNPAAGDVGKVMTVVEDTSGETPVYYWSAEDAPSGGGGPFLFEKKIQAGDVAGIKNIELTYVEGGTALADLKAAYDALATDPEKSAFLVDHLIIDAGGRRFLPDSINSPTLLTLAFAPVVVKLSGVETPANLYATIKVEPDSDAFLKGMTPTFYKSTGGTYTNSDISDIKMLFKIYIR